MKIKFHKNGSAIENEVELAGIKFTTEEKIFIGVLVGAAAFMGGFVFASITKMAVKSVMQDGIEIVVKMPKELGLGA
jgi:hypothetical protein